MRTQSRRCWLRLSLFNHSDLPSASFHLFSHYLFTYYILLTAIKYHMLSDTYQLELLRKAKRSRLIGLIILNRFQRDEERGTVPLSNRVLRRPRIVRGVRFGMELLPVARRSVFPLSNWTEEQKKPLSNTLFFFCSLSSCRNRKSAAFNALNRWSHLTATRSCFSAVRSSVATETNFISNFIHGCQLSLSTHRWREPFIWSKNAFKIRNIKRLPRNRKER